MFDAGVRAHYRSSQLAAPAMIARGHGLIVNVSFWAARTGSVLVAAALAKDYGFADVDGKTPRPLTIADV